MQNIIIYYFSGTGNTKKITGLFAEALEACGAKAEIRDIVACDAPVTDGYDAIGIAYPVHGFNTPEIVTDFAKKLPCGYGKPLFALKTSGEPLRLNDASSLELSRIAESKGYRFIGERHYVMPYNMVYRHSDAMAAKMLATAKARIPKDAQAVLLGTVAPLEYPLRARIMTVLCKIERPGMRLNGRLYKVNKDKCIGCMKCVRGCPVGNIEFENGKFRFGGNCIGCARCAFGCPADAITTGLLNPIKVNGAYNFDADPEEAVIGAYCRKSYEKYFADKSE